MSEPLVSVILPTYNRASFLEESVQSVLFQNYKNFELIIVDDGSTDTTAKHAKEWALDQRVQYFYQENRGVSSARNFGLNKAKGNWVAFLDSDDIWLPDKLRTQMDFFKSNPHVKVCQCEEIWIRRGVRVNPGLKHRKHSGWIFEKCLSLCLISPSAVVLHRDVFDRIGHFDELMPACEDYDLWLRLTLDYEVMTLPQALIEKRGGHEDQLSQKYWGMDRFRIWALSKLLKHPRLTLDQRKLVEEDIRKRYDILQKGAHKRGKAIEGDFFLQNVVSLIQSE